MCVDCEQITLDECMRAMENAEQIKTRHHEPIVYRVYDYMKIHHVGESNAISAEELSEVLGIDQRELRAIVRTIRMSGELEKIIVSSNKGYYLATEGEVIALVVRLIRHGAAEIKVARKVAEKAARDGQMKIALGPYYSEIYESICRIKEEREADDGGV